MNYKQAIILLRQKIASDINQQISQLNEALMKLQQEESNLIQQNALIPAADFYSEPVNPEIKNKIIDLNKRKLELEENPEYNSFTLLWIDNEIKRLQGLEENIDTTGETKLKEVQEEISKLKEQIKQLKFKAEEDIEIGIEDIDSTLEDVELNQISLLPKNITNNETKLRSEIEDERKKIENITQDPEVRRKVKRLIELAGIASAASGADKKGLNKQKNDILISVTNERVEEIMRKIDSLVTQLFGADNAEQDRKKIVNEEDTKNYRDYKKLYLDYFKNNKAYFVPAITKSFINHFLMGDVNEFFFNLDEETRNLNSPRMLDEPDMKRTEFAVELDEGKLWKEIENQFRTNKSIQVAILKETLPSFLPDEIAPNERMKYAKQINAAKVFLAYFMNPEATGNSKLEVGMPANIIMKSAFNTLVKRLHEIRDKTNDTYEVEIKQDEEFTQARAKEEQEATESFEEKLGLMVFKAMVNPTSQNVDSLAEAVRTKYMSLAKPEGNIWTRSVDLRPKTVDGELRVPVDISNEKSGREKAMQEFRAKGGKNYRIEKEVRNEFLINQYIVEVMNSLPGLNQVEQEMLNKLLGGDKRLAVRMSITFLKKRTAIFDAAIASPLRPKADAGSLEYTIRVKGTKQASLDNTIVQVGFQEPVFQEDGKINLVSQNFNIKTEIMKAIQILQEKNPDTSIKQIIKNNYEKIVRKVKKELFGKSYNNGRDIYNLVETDKRFEKIKEIYNNSIKRELEYMKAEIK